jgi:hypothetical protein
MNFILKFLEVTKEKNVRNISRLLLLIGIKFFVLTKTLLPSAQIEHQFISFTCGASASPSTPPTPQPASSNGSSEGPSTKAPFLLSISEALKKNK